MPGSDDERYIPTCVCEYIPAVEARARAGSYEKVVHVPAVEAYCKEGVGSLRETPILRQLMAAERTSHPCLCRQEVCGRKFASLPFNPRLSFLRIRSSTSSVPSPKCLLRLLLPNLLQFDSQCQALRSASQCLRPLHQSRRLLSLFHGILLCRREGLGTRLPNQVRPLSLSFEH